jgi:hypothetical protein
MPLVISEFNRTKDVGICSSSDDLASSDEGNLMQPAPKKQSIKFPLQLGDILKKQISSQDEEDHDHIIRSLIAWS